MMIRFHKNGVTLLEDANGVLHLLEPKESLRDIAKYIWHEDSLSSYRIGTEESWPGGKKEVKVVQLAAEKEQRLRTFADPECDSYYSDGKLSL